MATAMTEYERDVAELKGHVLVALQQHSEPDKAALALLQAALPSVVAAQQQAQQEGGTALKPLSARDRDRLGAAIHAATGDLITGALGAKVEVMQYCAEGRDQPLLAELLDAAIWLAEQKNLGLDTAIPANCLERVVDAVTVAECEGVFAYLDSRIAFFKKPFAYKQCYLSLLRTCNMLLRRLSKSHNAMLCGRILLFLAKLLPLTERSGVNLHGNFNTSNTTTVEEAEEGAVDSEGKPVDVEFYRTFWGLQAYFADPPRALQPGNWARVAADIRRVLDKFKSVGVSITESAPGTGRLSDGLGISVKYLSSSRLIGLQLRDTTTRRHFLLQCLILLQWCERPNQKDIPGSLKPVKGRVLEDLHSLQRQIYSALEATPEHGREFAAAVRHILSWEDTWTAWKKAGCPADPMQRPPAKMPANAPAVADLFPPPKRRRISPEAYFGVRVGTDELDRLWNLTEDNLTTLGADDRGGFKSLRQLMEPVIADMNEGEDDSLKASKNKLYSWKTLRALARDNLAVFAQAVQKGGDLEVAARALYPEECPPPPAAPDASVGAGKPSGGTLTAGILPMPTPEGTAAGGAAGGAGAVAAGGGGNGEVATQQRQQEQQQGPGGGDAEMADAAAGGGAAAAAAAPDAAAAAADGNGGDAEMAEAGAAAEGAEEGEGEAEADGSEASVETVGMPPGYTATPATRAAQQQQQQRQGGDSKGAEGKAGAAAGAAAGGKESAAKEQPNTAS